MGSISQDQRSKCYCLIRSKKSNKLTNLKCKLQAREKTFGFRIRKLRKIKQNSNLEFELTLGESSPTILANIVFFFLCETETE